MPKSSRPPAREPLDAAAVARLLIEFGQRTELADDSPYKARAYQRAAESLQRITVPLEEVVAEGRLRDLPGVGAAIADKILVLQRTGTHPELEALRRDMPDSTLELLRIPGLGAAKVRQILREFGVRSAAELETAIRQGRLQGAKGLGPALQQRVLEGIAVLGRSRGRRLLHQAGEILATTAQNLKASHPELGRIVAAGDFRRGCELVHELSLVAEMPEAGAGIGSTWINDEIELTISGGDRYGVALLLATGSAAHVKALTARAAERGLSLDRSGLMRGGKLLPSRDDKDVYRALGLAFVEPELREGGDEIVLAAAKKLPKLVRPADIKGVLHCHTDCSDGTASLAEMAEAARARGYAYFGVADHSQSAAYAGGLTTAAIEAQQREADALNASYGGRFRIFKGIESDILLDGSLDYPEGILKTFDFVVASIHSRFRLDEAAQTERILRAVVNRYTTILGHMTGRMLLRRDGYALDVERVLQACAERGVAVEINASPRRLDLDWRWHRRALELGCMLSINPDAHSTAELDFMRWGVTAARKGGVPKERVLNCMGLKEIEAFLAKRKEGGIRTFARRHLTTSLSPRKRTRSGAVRGP